MHARATMKIHFVRFVMCRCPTIWSVPLFFLISWQMNLFLYECVCVCRSSLDIMTLTSFCKHLTSIEFSFGWNLILAFLRVSLWPFLFFSKQKKKEPYSNSSVSKYMYTCTVYSRRGEIAREHTIGQPMSVDFGAKDSQTRIHLPVKM